MEEVFEQIERVCISANSICNLACDYCYFFNPDNHIENTKKLSTEEIFNILENIYQYSKSIKLKKPIKINFVGSGEPLISWREISQAVNKMHIESKTTNLKFYTVTNATLMTEDIAKEMLVLKITPSVSLDGPEEIHNLSRKYKTGTGSFQKTMEGIEILRSVGFDVAINTTINWNLINNLDSYFQFIKDEKFSKVIFDRLVDTPKEYAEVPYDKFYETLKNIYEYKIKYKLENLEIGNIEAYKRALTGKPDKVCTMFGSTCGAGINNIIYMQREVYPCGRMFGKSNWILGTLTSSLKEIQDSMFEKSNDYALCSSCSVRNSCVKDCIMEQEREDYDCSSRVSFIKFMKKEIESGKI